MNSTQKEEQRQLWIARICDLTESGMTQEEWCRNHSIPVSTLRYWMRKLRNEADPAESEHSSWLKVDLSSGGMARPLELPGTHHHTEGGLNVRFGDFTLEIGTGSDLRQVYEVLRVLKAL